MTRKQHDVDFEPNLLVFERISEGANDVLSPIQIALRVWARRYLVAAFVIVTVALGFGFLAIATPKYTVEMLIGPAGGNVGDQADTPGGGAALALAGVFGIGAASTDTPFTRFEALFVSERTAALVEEKYHISRDLWKGQWQDSTQSWEYNPVGLTWLKDQVKIFLGLPVWQTPNAAKIAETIGSLVEMKPLEGVPYVKVKIEHANPVFAANLLKNFFKETNSSLRDEAARQTRSRIEFLRGRLTQETIQEYRQSLIILLADQEKSLMLASSDQPFAAVILDGPTISSRPTFPRPTVVFVLSLAAGLSIGSLVAFIAQSRRLARQESAE